MSRSIYEVSLTELLPPSLKYDPLVIAASQATDPQVWALANAINIVSLYNNLENLSSEMCDYFAIELNADFYDQTLPLANKQALIVDALPFKFYKGTPWATLQIVNDYLSLIPNQIFDYTQNPFAMGITPIGYGAFWGINDIQSAAQNSTPTIYEYSVEGFMMGRSPMGENPLFNATERNYYEVHINFTQPYSHQQIENAISSVNRKSQRAIVFHSGQDTSPLSEASNAVVIIN